MTTSRPQRKWLVSEDQTLRVEVEAQMVEGEVKDWCRIASKLPGRTNKDCRKRWKNSVEPGLKKGQWSKSEDMQLLQGVQRHGQKWTLVADTVKSRSADQCAKRWQQSLDPELDRSEWQDHEDRILIQAVQQLGTHWKDIQHRHFPGRSKNCIKNRHTVLVRKSRNSPRGAGLDLNTLTHRGPTSSNGDANSVYDPSDADRMSYTPSSYDEPLLAPFASTHESTPEIQYPHLDDQPYPTMWDSQTSLSATSPAMSGFQQTHSFPSPSPSQWDFVTPAVSMSFTSNQTLPAVYVNNAANTADGYQYPPSPPSFPSFSTHSPYLNPQPSPNPSPPRKMSSRSPFPNTVGGGVPRQNVPTYEDPEAMARYVRYAIQNHSPYAPM